MLPANTEAQVKDYIELLGWDESDDIEVQVGGALTSGIHQIEGVNPKWSKPFGTTTYHSDAFIVIKNKSRNPVVSFIADPTLKAHHDGPT